MKRRRGARIPGRIWMQMVGVDEEMLLRRGDISISGIYIETTEQVGAPGTVRSLRIAPYGRESTIELLARVVRVVSVEDLWRSGPGICGAAMEFLPASGEQRNTLEQIIRHVMASKSYVAESVVIESNFEAQVTVTASGADADAVIARNEADTGEDTSTRERVEEPSGPASVGISVMVLETSWPVKPGEPLICTIESPVAQRRARLLGRVVRVTRETKPDQYRVEVAFVREQQEPTSKPESSTFEGRSISDAIDSLLDDVVFPATDPSQTTWQGLHGPLSNIGLAKLLLLAEQEKVTGRLEITHADGVGRIYLYEGGVVDAQVDGDGEYTAQSALGEMCVWEGGSFELFPDDTNRENRFNVTTSTLLAALGQKAGS